jgi:hypothetical protein
VDHQLEVRREGREATVDGEIAGERCDLRREDPGGASQAVHLVAEGGEPQPDLRPDVAAAGDQRPSRHGTQEAASTMAVVEGGQASLAHRVEVAVGQLGRGHAARRVDPQERPAPPEVAERGRASASPVQCGSLVP